MIPSQWTEERIECLIGYWNKGYSAGQIAALMKVSRNAVIGKLHRLKKKDQITGHRGKPRATLPRNKRKAKSGPKPPTPLPESFTTPLPAAPAAPPPAAPAPAAPPATPAKPQRPQPPPPPAKLTILNITSRQCRWPINDTFCGEPKAENSSYCQKHKIRSLSGYARLEEPIRKPRTA